MEQRMIKTLFLVGALVGVPLGSMAQKGAAFRPLHTPRKGSAEEQSILKGLRNQGSEYYQKAVSFKVEYLKVHGGWAWADVVPLDAHHKATAEGGPSLLQLKAGRWTTLDLSKVPADPNNPMGPEDISPVYIKNLRKQFPGLPADILPRPAH